MYGMIHKAIRDMVKTVHGEQAWLSVLNESGAADGDFLSLRSYNDEIAYNLVGACSKILGAPAEACLEDFGRFWILVTASEHYGDMMRSYGQDTFSLLGKMDEMHESIRAGLSPFVLGLVLGLGEFYSEPVSIALDKTENADVGEYSVFSVTRGMAAGA